MGDDAMKLDTPANHLRVVRLLEALEWGGTYGHECCPLCDCTEPDSGASGGDGVPAEGDIHSDRCELAAVLRQLRAGSTAPIGCTVPASALPRLRMFGYLALFHLGKEATGTAYARVAVTLGKRQKVVFPQPASTWGPATEIRLMSEPTDGIELYREPWMERSEAPIEMGERVEPELQDCFLTTV